MLSTILHISIALTFIYSRNKYNIVKEFCLLPCSPSKVNQRFGRTCLQGRRISQERNQHKAVNKWDGGDISSETSVDCQQTIRHYIAEGGTFEIDIQYGKKRVRENVYELYLCAQHLAPVIQFKNSVVQGRQKQWPNYAISNITYTTGYYVIFMLLGGVKYMSLLRLLISI
jgi:uncharacterized protein YjhX (UPF0386 family)